MKLERVRCTGFGALRDFDTGEEALTGLVVVAGPNEAGKSTFFEVLVSLLYGFRPASRDTHPYVPRGDGEIDIEATIRSDEGRASRIHRRLLSTPFGRLERDGEAEDLRNHPLPSVRHVDRRVYRHVYALTLSELASLAGDTWNEIQDRLLGGMGARDLVPIRAAVEVLEQEAGALWRPTRHGNQKIRETNVRIHATLARRQEALERDRDLRRLTREAADAAAELRLAREGRAQRRLALDTARRLQPVRMQLHRIEELERRAGPPEVLEDLPEAPGESLAAARDTCQRLESRLASIEDDEAPLRSLLEAFGEPEKRYIDARADIQPAVAMAAALGPDRARTAAIEQEIQDLERRRQRLGRELLTCPVSELEAGTLQGVRTAELLERIRTFARSRDERARLELHSPFDPAARAPTAMLFVDGVAMLAGAGLALWGSISDQTALIVAGGALVITAAAALVHWWWLRRGGGRTPSGESAGKSADGPRAREREALEAVHVLLKDVPIHQGLMEDPTLEVASSLTRLQEFTSDLEARHASLDEIHARVEEFDARLRDLGTRLDVALPPDGSGAAHMLDRHLRQAEAAHQQATAAERELGRIGLERTRLGAELDAEQKRLCALEGVLASLAGSDLAAGLEEAEERLQARNRAIQMMDELRRIHPDLDEVVLRVQEAERAGEDWTLDPDALVQAATEVDELTDRIEALGKQAVALDHDVAHLERQPTVDRVDGQEAALQEEVAWLRRTRDRKFVLARLLREADRRFREEHQPDVILRAGEYLGRITGGHYDRLSRDDRDEGTRFLLHGPKLAEPVEVDDTTSTGTREQVYLALRLAIVDHLDRDQERLPLLLDEVFVNWDEARRGRGLDVLADISRTRQVFACTCHEGWAAELESRGARVIRL